MVGWSPIRGSPPPPSSSSSLSLSFEFGQCRCVPAKEAKSPGLLPLRPDADSRSHAVAEVAATLVTSTTLTSVGLATGEAASAPSAVTSTLQGTCKREGRRSVVLGWWFFFIRYELRPFLFFFL